LLVLKDLRDHKE